MFFSQRWKLCITNKQKVPYALHNIFTIYRRFSYFWNTNCMKNLNCWNSLVLLWLNLSPPGTWLTCLEVVCHADAFVPKGSPGATSCGLRERFGCVRCSKGCYFILGGARQFLEKPLKFAFNSNLSNLQLSETNRRIYWWHNCTWIFIIMHDGRNRGSFSFKYITSLY